MITVGGMMAPSSAAITPARPARGITDKHGKFERFTARYKIGESHRFHKLWLGHDLPHTFLIQQDRWR